MKGRLFSWRSTKSVQAVADTCMQTVSRQVSRLVHRKTSVIQGTLLLITYMQPVFKLERSYV